MKLFEPIRIGPFEVRNRTAFAPTHMGHAGPRGEVTDQVLCHYSARAKGGVGLVITEGVGVLGKYAFSIGGGLVFLGDAYRRGLRNLAEVIHLGGARAVAQIIMGQGAQALFHHSRRDLVAPSEISVALAEEHMPKAMRGSGPVQGETARPMTVDEIDELVAATVEAARAMKMAGFDGVELHGAHGYLLAEFVSPYFNQRRDEYGGSFENRLRLPLRLIEEVRQAVGDRFIIGYRQSGDEHIEGGLDLAMSVQVAGRLAEAGIDYFHLSSGCYPRLNWTFPDEEGTLLPEARAFTRAIDVPVICPNVHDPKTAEQAVVEKTTDVVSLSRSLLVDPDWPNKAREGRFDEIRRCRFCCTCVKSMNRYGTGVRCTQNPELGWERFIPRYYPFA
ncbi:MAG: NADH:flavin oxidoreductase [Proteobacteria bacterium]|nr:NADH:flavin oxidoreductase [Pseudomonadota bacterium]